MGYGVAPKALWGYEILVVSNRDSRTIISSLLRHFHLFQYSLQNLS